MTNIYMRYIEPHLDNNNSPYCYFKERKSIFLAFLLVILLVERPTQASHEYETFEKDITIYERSKGNLQRMEEEFGKPFILEGLKISKIGFGALQLSAPEITHDKAKEILNYALQKGVSFFDTAAAYGIDRHNEKLLGEVFDNNTDVVLSTKCGIDFNKRQYTQSPEEIEDSIELSLKNLRRKQLDLVYLHRIDPNTTPIAFEKTIATLKNLVVKGKIKHIGLSEPTKEDLLKAIEIEPKSIPISSVQGAYSLFTRRADVNGILEICRENGILFVSYTSILRGLADKRLKEITEQELNTLSASQLQERVFKLLNIDSISQSVGWFSDEYIHGNIKLAQKFIQEAERLGVTPAQLNLRWAMLRGVVPIPGTTKIDHLSENIAALEIKVSDQEIHNLEHMFPFGAFKGIPNPTALDIFNNDHMLEK